MITILNLLKIVKKNLEIILKTIGIIIDYLGFLFTKNMLRCKDLINTKNKTQEQILKTKKH